MTFASNKAPLVVTSGDPAGIGLEALLKAWLVRQQEELAPFYVVTNAVLLRSLVQHLALPVPIKIIHHSYEAEKFFKVALPVMSLESDPSLTLGKGDAKQAGMIITAIERAVQHCLEGKARAMVTLPINKKLLYRAGFDAPGHTEYLANLADCGGSTVMMLACDTLKVVPVTLHCSLREAIAQLSAQRLQRVIETTDVFLREVFDIAKPRLAIAGLNPHAGEGGAMGREERDFIAPHLAIMRRKGYDLQGPLPADTLFHPRARSSYDVALCMYHDQALIPIKTIAFDEAVNITMGLPFIRTSPDHGTAYDIAGKGTARADSLIAAIKLADRLS